MNVSPVVDRKDVQKMKKSLAVSSEDQHSMSANVSINEFKSRKVVPLNQMDQNWVNTTDNKYKSIPVVPSSASSKGLAS